MTTVRTAADSHDRAQMGGKAWALAVLGPDFPVPDWFVVTPEAFNGAGLAAAAEEEIGSHLASLGEGPFAVRSSAVDEDGAESSFAGQLASFLNVPIGEVTERVLAVRASAFRQSVIEYRDAHGKTGPAMDPAVLVQRMVDASAAGVAFSRDPVDPASSDIVISATCGLADRLVSGEIDGDHYRVPRIGDAIAAEPADAVRVLSDEEARAVADLAVRAEEHFGLPQDIEWAFQDGKLFILQSRPITTLPRGTRTIWDNSNIVESYSGVTSPLTFSFARYVYAEVYRAFCGLMGVSRARVEDNHWVFDNMLGRIQGHVYYNLLNWYRALALFPGFKANRAFMEQMMGVAEALPAEIAEEISPTRPGRWERVIDVAHLAHTLVRLIGHAIWLPRTVQAFYDRVDEALEMDGEAISELDLQELASHYRMLEKMLLARWDAPLINDFLCMIAFGLSRKVVCRWLGEEEGGALHNAYMIGQGDIVSAEPAQRIKTMARKVAKVPDLAEALASGDRGALSDRSDIEADVADYLHKFGDRCAQELKLESITLEEDPTPLLQAVGYAARRVDEATDEGQVDDAGGLAMAFAGKPARRVVATGLLRWAKARVRDRENLRFERTRVFGRVRRVFLAMGQHLADAGILDSRRDVFCLEVKELLGLVDGTATTTDWRALATLRQGETEEFAAMPEPPSRFETYGAVGLDLARRPLARSSGSATGETRSGLGCCQGVVRARVRVVRDPRTESLRPGEILVAQHTDPGWIALFSAAAGILVERGSLLSHSAIVAREMSIPAVVSLPGLLEWLRTGDLVEMDGATGGVVRIEAADDVD